MGIGFRRLESMGLSPDFWRGRRVLVTGHTGFKGSWLGLMLARLGAVTTGYALSPEDGQTLFQDAKVARHLRSVVGDIRDLPALRAAAFAAEPEIILHLAAQSLVLTSYQAPLDTFSTNVIGTANLLQVCREVPSVRAVVVITNMALSPRWIGRRCASIACSHGASSAWFCQNIRFVDEIADTPSPRIVSVRSST